MSDDTIKIQNIQGRIKDSQIPSDGKLLEAASRGNAVIKSIPRPANKGVLDIKTIGQARQQIELLTKQINWLLDMFGDLLKDQMPEDSKLIRGAINKVKRGDFE